MVTTVGVIWPKTWCWIKNKKLDSLHMCVFSSAHTTVFDCMVSPTLGESHTTNLHFCRLRFKCIEFPASFS